jgi:autotransporter translocation and assembly factor TamB
VNGVTAVIVIGGRAQNPQITFTSTPALPQDEVLARLLFGSSVTSLSPTQAIQLAAALNSLRGSGGGLNPLGKLRRRPASTGCASWARTRPPGAARRWRRGSTFLTTSMWR